MVPSPIILYSYFRSSCSYRVRIALNLKGLDFEYRAVHLVKDGGEQLKDDYIQLNPKGEVPFLIHGDIKVSQSMAIIDYLDGIDPSKTLISQDLATRAKCIELCELINSGIQPIQNLKVMNTLVSKLNANDDQKKDWSKFFIEEGFIALEEQLKRTAGKFSLGDEVSAVDCFLVPQVYNANRFKVDMNRFPTIRQVNANCLEMDEFKKASPEEQPDFN